MAKLTAVKLARLFANGVANKLNVDPEQIHIRNKAQANEHGYTHNAEATICFESGCEIMIEMTMEQRWLTLARENGFFFEPYSSWLIAVYK